jgi:hypothetical protein
LPKKNAVKYLMISRVIFPRIPTAGRVQCTPGQAESTGGHEMVVRLLLEKGVDVNTQGGARPRSRDLRSYENSLPDKTVYGHPCSDYATNYKSVRLLRKPISPKIRSPGKTSSLPNARPSATEKGEGDHQELSDKDCGKILKEDAVRHFKTGGTRCG